MKKLLLMIPLLFMAANSYANHKQILNATNLTFGTIPNARYDISTVTLRGQLSDGTQDLRIKNLVLTGTYTSTNSVTMSGSTFTSVYVNGDVAAKNVIADTMTVYGGVTSTTGFSGSGTNLTALNATRLTLGTVPNARIDESSVTKLGNIIDLSDTVEVTGNLSVNNLNSGTNANAGTFWRGDGAWATPAGGGGTAVSSTPAGIYSVVVGTLGVSGFYVDIATNNVFDAIVKSSSILNGSAGNVFFRNGDYNLCSVAISSVIIPANMTVICASSCTWKVNTTSAGIILQGAPNKMATLKGANIDVAGKAYTGVLIDQRSNSSLFNSNIYGAYNIDTNWGILLRTINSTNTYTYWNKFDDFYYGLNSTDRRSIFEIKYSTENYFRYNYVGGTPSGANGHLFNWNDMSESWNDHNYYANVTNYSFAMWGSTNRSGVFRNFHFNDNIINWTNTASDAVVHAYDNGLIMIVSSGCTVSNNTIQVKNAATGTFLALVGASNIWNMTIAGNIAYVSGTGSRGSLIFSNIAANSIGAILMNNHTTGFGTFISDSGTNTKFTANDNFLDAVEQ